VSVVAIVRSKFVLLGAVIVVSIFLMTGSVPIVSGTGRYQLDSWGHSNCSGTSSYGAFVIDTVTGVTQVVYQVETTKNSSVVTKNSLGRHFNAMDARPPEPGQPLEVGNKLGRRVDKDGPH
jgi:hypothetical protein